MDTCVLYPATLRDLLLRLAEVGLFRPGWSADILAELRRNLITSAHVQPLAVDRLIAAMQRTFPDSEITDYQSHIDQMHNHPKDRHVLAAAFVGNARIIVTQNVRHFPDKTTNPEGVVAQTPDHFLCQLLDDAPTTVIRSIHAQLATFRRPAYDADALVAVLGRHVPVFGVRIRERLA